MTRRKGVDIAARSVTSPRLRGEVDTPERSEGVAGEGDFPRAQLVEGAPHPNPLPASAERERSGASGSPALYRLMAWLSPAYPVGAFSYSGGIEWAVESGDIKDAETLKRWLAVVIGEGGGFCDAVFFVHAHRAIEVNDDKALRDVVELAAAFAPSKERHLETTAQGRSCPRRRASSACPA